MFMWLNYLFRIKVLCLTDNETTQLKNSYSRSFESIKVAIWLFKDVIVFKHIHPITKRTIVLRPSRKIEPFTRTDLDGPK